ncbi:MAG TPA: BON domain-containing protein [Methylophilaceae bacterium]|jgi:hyperosmotically inducible protein
MNIYPPCKPSFGSILTLATLSIGLGFGVAFAADEDAAPQAHSDGLGAVVSDTIITGKVKAKFVGEDSLTNSQIIVTTTNGVVTLKGSATSQDAANIALEDAKAVEGVKSVDNELTTPHSNKTLAKTKRVMSDSWITTKVKSVLLADNVGNGVDVTVETTHGVVALKGALPNQNAIDHVKELAGQVESVKSVDTTKLVVARK